MSWPRRPTCWRKNRQLPQPDFSNFNQTPEEIERDLRFVNTV